MTRWPKIFLNILLGLTFLWSSIVQANDEGTTVTLSLKEAIELERTMYKWGEQYYERRQQEIAETSDTVYGRLLEFQRRYPQAGNLIDVRRGMIENRLKKKEPDLEKRRRNWLQRHNERWDWLPRHNEK